VPTDVDTDASLITKANMNSPRSRELLGLKINYHGTARSPARATTPASLGEQTNATRLIVRRSPPPERSIIQATLCALREGDVHAI
jgi:hypothetical protein